MKIKQEIKNYYFVIIPILITILVYSISLTYDFRNFDEDILIKNFYVHKTLGEYIEKFFLIHAGGASEAYGFAFSSIKNIHVCFLGMPSIYLLAYLFKAKAFLYHFWSLILHCSAVFFFSLFCFQLTKNKIIALFSALLWTLLPTNVEPVIWATDWLQLLGATFYFFTLYKVTYWINQNKITNSSLVLLGLISIIQILFTEHTITIPFAILLTTFYIYAKSNPKESFTNAFKISLPSFLIIGIYWLLRNLLISRTISNASQNHLSETISRITFLTPQVFLHQLKLIFFPVNLTIDQIDLIKLDSNFLRGYHLFSLTILFAFILLAFISYRYSKYLSLGLLLYLITIGPFIEIIPLYSITAERYNYLGSAFLLFGIIAVLHKLFENKYRLIIPILIICCLCLGVRSFARIADWKNSQTLFLSTINTSKSLFKKGIWTYNLAICQSDTKKKEELLKLSINLLDLFIQNQNNSPQNALLKKYELDNDSLKAKAAQRIATNYEILNDRKNDLKYLLKALDFSIANSQTQSLIFKNLGTFYFQEGNLNKSLEYYKKSNLISPNPSIDYAISICYLKMNDSVNYEKYLQKAASVISHYNVSPFKTAVKVDVDTLQMLGTSRRDDIHLGLEQRLKRFIANISRKVDAGGTFDTYAPILEMMCRKYNPGWLLLARWHMEQGAQVDLLNAKESLRRFLENQPTGNDVDEAWEMLGEICNRTNDPLGEVHALIERAQISSVPFYDVSNTANRLNRLLHHGDLEVDLEEKRHLAKTLLSVLENRRKEAGADDLSRMAWLAFHLDNESKAREYAKAGLERDPENNHCSKILMRLDSMMSSL